MSDLYDLIVIGGGSGGVAAARYAARLGAKVLLAEADRLGGTCVIRGCVPKKLMVYAAGYAQSLREAAGYGYVDVGGRFELARWADAKAREIDRLEGVYRGMLADAGVEVVAARARFVDAGTVALGDDRRVRASRVLVATGGSPVADALPGLAGAMTSTDVLDLRTLPSSAIVVGGGYIAVEFASILAGIGVAVTLAMRAGAPLRGFDDDLRSRLAMSLAARGVTLACGVALVGAGRSDDGGWTLSRADGSVLRAEALLNATGRRPNTAGLGLDAVGVALDEHGAIAVDADSRTSVPGIWAVGDVTNRVNLTPVAIAEGRAFVDTEFGRRPARVDHRTVASAVFTDPPLASVGLTEEEAVACGAVDVYAAEFRPMRTAFVGSAAKTYMKLVVDGLSDRVLGVHMLGPDAPEIVQSLAVALTAGATKRDFDRTLAVHPTAAEEFVLMREPVRRRACGAPRP